MYKRFDKSAIIDQINIVVKSYGLRSMANELNKPYSTMANELNEEGWSKLGFRDVMAILEISQRNGAPDQCKQAGLLLLHMVVDAYGFVAYQVPESRGDMIGEMMLVARLSKEFSLIINRMAEAMADGKWDKDEVKACIKENRELLKACLQIDGHLDRMQTMQDVKGGLK